MFSRYFDQKCVLDLTAELKALILSTTIYPVPMGKVEISGYKTKHTRRRTKKLCKWITESHRQVKFLKWWDAHE